MYILLKTSFALIVPTVLAYFVRQYDVANTSLMCLLISICNHSVKGQNKLIKTVDILIQHGSGVYLSLHSVILAVARRKVVYLIPVSMAIMLAMVYWKVIHCIPCTSNLLYKHAIMHITGSLCICCYSIIMLHA